MGASTILNLLQRSDVSMVTEGLHVLRVPVPPPLAGQTVKQSQIHATTGCTVIALNDAAHKEIDPAPHVPLPHRAEMILIGASEGEQAFLRQ